MVRRVNDFADKWGGPAAFWVALLATTALTETAFAQENRPSSAPNANSRMDMVPIAQAPAQDTVAFDIPAQPLSSALTTFVTQSGFQVSVDQITLGNLRSTAVTGRITPEEALRRMLAGTGVTWRFADNRSVYLTKGPEATRGAITLDPVTVEGRSTAPSQAEIGNLPPPYAGGQVARGGKLGLLGNRDMMDTPFSQTSYTQKTIQDQQAVTLADVLDNDPSVRSNFPAGSGIDQANIRGFVAGNQDVAFGGLYGVAPTSNGMMAVESIERVEILKGPSALLNGMAPFGSIGGAINIVPKRAGDRPITEFNPSYHSDSQFGGHFDVGRRFGRDDSAGVRFNGLYRDGDTPIDRQSQETGLAALGLDFRGESVRLSADLGYQSQYTDATRRPVTVAAGVAVPDAPRSSSNWSQPWTFTENKNTYGAIRGEVDIGENVTAFAAAGGGLRHGESISENLVVQNIQGRVTGNPTALSTYEDTSTVEVGVRGSVATGLVQHNLSLANTIFWKESGNAFASAAIPASNLYNPVFVGLPSFASLPDPADVPRTGEQQLSSLAFADTLSVLNERIQLTLGARRQRVNADNFNGTTGARTSSYDKSALSPAVGLILKPLEYVSLYGNYIEGLSQGSAAPTTAANAGELLPPFQTEQYEAGIKIDFGKLATTLSVFQVSQPSAFTNPVTNVFGADGEQRHRGVELAAFGELTEDIRILGGVTLIDSELTKTQGGVNLGNDGIGVPWLQANVGGEWDTPFLRRLTVSGRAIYTSSQYLNAANTQEVPAWTRFDVGARYVVETASMPITIRANVYNVFDESYWASVAPSFSGLGLSAPRTFLLSTSFNF